MTKLPRRSALDLAAALRAREVSAVELLEACLAEVDRLNDSLNAVIWRDDDAARAEARAADERLSAGEGAPFLGVPIPIKDLTEVNGQPVTYGSRGRPLTPWEGESETVVDALRAAGFVLAGRTNTPEFGHITATENLRWGVTRNPWDVSRTPGGSSGGAAAATASGMFPLAHANDGGGSIRIPASCCGLVGLKPSRGRVPRRAQSWLGAVVEGAVTRTVADAAAVLDAIAGPDPYAWYNAPVPERPFAAEVAAGSGPLRVGLMTSGPAGMPIDPACAEAARRAGEALEQLGHAVDAVDVATVSEQLIEPFVFLIEAALGEQLGDVDFERAEPHIAAQVANAQSRSAFEYARVAKDIELLSRELMAPWGRDFDVLVTPTMAVPPPPAGAIMEVTHADPSAPSELVIATVAFTAFANVTGQPAISLPLHESEDGLPIGVQLVGSPFAEATLLALAGGLEAALPWTERQPAVAQLSAT
ncbi:MAG TPA: amidase [Solirubrobacteraceae bacterium]|jgi:amidase|nr:amidase [Solirubrobacteraceae bacterium]